MIGKKISQYLILEKLGEGGMGIVYLAEDTVLGRRVAFKSLKPSDAPQYNQFKIRFLREARLASNLNHPNIVSVYDYGETEDGHPYLVMEYVKGKNLSDILRQKPLSVAQCVEIIKQIAKALSAAHEHGIIHRDLKPSNIFINERDQVKVLDFGLAKLLDADSYNSKNYSSAASDMFTQTREGVFMGTPSYSSPEQLLGTSVDRRSDIFSLGAVLYECLSGQPAFGGKNFAEICSQVIKEDPLPPSHLNFSVSPGYDEVALKALSKKAENRYQTIDELIKDLETAQLDSPTRKIAANPETFQVETKTSNDVLPVTSNAFFKKHLAVISVAAIIALVVIYFGANGNFRNLLTTQNQAQPTAEFYEGVDAIRNGNYYKAQKLLETAVAQNDRFPLAHARLAEALVELGYEDKATREILKVSELTPTFSNLSEIDKLNLQAIAATVRRNYAGAIENYRNIIEKTSEENKKFAYFDLGRAFEENDETDSAIENYSEAARRDERFAAAFLRLGMLYGRKQETAKANDAFAKAENIYTAQSDYDGTAEVFYRRGTLLNIQDKLPEADAQLKHAYDIASVSQNPSLQVRILLQMSSVAYTLSDHATAQKYADQAIELARAEQLENLATVGLLDAGNIYFTRGELTEAENKFKQALGRAETNEWQSVIARAKLSLGSLYLQQTKSAEAINFIEPALDFYQKNNFQKETLQAQLLLGYANDQNGNYDAAIKVFSEQLQTAKELNDKSSVIWANYYIGLVLFHKESFSDALVYFDESLKLSKALGIESKTGYSLLNRAQSLWQLGRFDEFDKTIDEAMQIAQKSDTGDKYLSAWTYLVKAQSDLSRQNYKSATDESQKAIDLSDLQLNELIVQATFTKGLADSRSGAKKTGRDLCLKADQDSAKLGVAYLSVKSKTALAETLLANGEAQEALNIILDLQKSFTDSANLSTQWQGFTIAAQANQILGNKTEANECFTRANQILSKLEETFGAENYKSYVAKGDVQSFLRQLEKLSKL